MNIKLNISQLGTAGLFLTAIFSPCCFPIFAMLGSVLGLGSMELFGPGTMWVFQGMMFLTLTGLYISYRRHKCMYPLLTAGFGALLIIYGFYFNDSNYWDYLLYSGMLGLLAGTIWNVNRNRQHKSCLTDPATVSLLSTITCPYCGTRKEELMPVDACTYFYECSGCRKQLRPLKGDCCVYCSYGSTKCPPIQNGTSCC